MKLARLHVRTLTEPFWHVQLAMVAAVGLQFLLNPELTFTSKYYVAAAELLLLVALSLPSRKASLHTRHWRRGAAFLLIFLISAANLTSLALIIQQLFNEAAVNGHALLLSGLAVYVTNIIIFGLWYWELDDIKDAQGIDSAPVADFLFPQTSQSKNNWRPTFFDYLYVSITNASAFSPTDTLPLTHRAKLLMSFQSLTSLVTVALVAARAVNILS